MDKPEIRPEEEAIIEVRTYRPEEENPGRDLSYGNLFELARLLTEGELDQGFDNVRKVPRPKLVDLINYLNFSGREGLVVFRHPQYQEIITRAIKPQPCQEGTLVGGWVRPEDFREFLRDFEVLCFMVETKREILLARTRRVEIDEQGIELTLPEFGFKISLRKTDRYPGREIKAEMTQDGILFPGRLEVFSVKAFRVEFQARDGTSLKWINAESPVQILFKDGEEICYSRQCRIIRQKENLNSKILILQPSQEPIHRFKHREFRAPRPTLHPAPAAYFMHPLIKK
jgi:hypothetical protein